MATAAKNPSSAQLVLLMSSALWQAHIAFGPHRHPAGFGYKFCTLGFLIGTWVWFWRSLARRFYWPFFVRFLVPSALFVLPLIALHAQDKTMGSGPGDYYFAIVTLAVIGFFCAQENW